MPALKNHEDHSSLSGEICSPQSYIAAAEEATAGPQRMFNHRYHLNGAPQTYPIAQKKVRIDERLQT
jgi:hypothetical protein